MIDFNSPDYMRKLLESIQDQDGYEFDSREEAILDRAWGLVDLLAEYAEDGFAVIPDRDFRLAFVAEYQRLEDARESQDDGNLLAAANSFIAKLDPFWLDDDFEKIEDRAAKLAIIDAYRKLSNAVHDIMDDEDMVNEGKFRNWTVDFQPGDRVKIIHGDHAGTIGTVRRQLDGGSAYLLDVNGRDMTVHTSVLGPDKLNEEEDLVNVHGIGSMRRDQAERGAEGWAETIFNDIRRGKYSPSDADTLKSYLIALSDSA